MLTINDPVAIAILSIVTATLALFVLMIILVVYGRSMRQVKKEKGLRNGIIAQGRQSSMELREVTSRLEVLAQALVTLNKRGRKP